MQPSSHPTFEVGVHSVDGTELHYRVAGDPDDPALVFLHAGIADSRMWDGFAGRFADRFRVVTYDLRGFGRSRHARGTFSHVGDLGTLLDALGAESASLVGASMGGAVAVDFALSHPERVDSLSLLAPAVGGYDFEDEATLDGWAEAEEAFEAGDYDAAARIEMDVWLAGPDRALDGVGPDLVVRVREMLLRSYELDAAGGEEVDGVDGGAPAVDRLGDLDVPTLVVVGEGDTSDMRRIARLVERDVPDARLHTVAGVAHLPSVERPETVAGVVSSFLDGVRQAVEGGR
ncbi:alpha/beta fold hydrolase [Halobium salinum]|uniref:Alpha/beta fold hydrolase n=1 Tax=Halobium salinum TaxID=1364940 RepID=A0ABD5P6P4_9EURY|nr:alpha/beta fold hydrolase [Halobium salinum]